MNRLPVGVKVARRRCIGQFVRRQRDRASVIPVVDRIHVVGACLDLEFSNQAAQRIRLGGGEIMDFCRVVAYIEQHPVVQGNVLGWRLQRNNLPVAADVAAVALQLIVLALTMRRRGGVGQHVGEADAIDGSRAVPIEDRRMLAASQLEQGR